MTVKTVKTKTNGIKVQYIKQKNKMKKYQINFIIV